MITTKQIHQVRETLQSLLNDYEDRLQGEILTLAEIAIVPGDQLKAYKCQLKASLNRTREQISSTVFQFLSQLYDEAEPDTSTPNMPTVQAHAYIDPNLSMS